MLKLNESRKLVSGLVLAAALTFSAAGFAPVFSRNGNERRLAELA